MTAGDSKAATTIKQTALARLRNSDQLRRRERYQQSAPIKEVPFGSR
jgi:hypothetical protein